MSYAARLNRVRRVPLYRSSFALMLTTGLNDPRVSSWEPTKMTARLQAATSSKNPILLRIETDAGHGIGSTLGQRDRETADTLAFLFWRTGDPRYQP